MKKPLKRCASGPIARISLCSWYFKSSASVVWHQDQNGRLSGKQVKGTSSETEDTNMGDAVKCSIEEARSKVQQEAKNHYLHAIEILKGMEPNEKVNSYLAQYRRVTE